MEFYSNGKLLISGEYVVLDGALAFALPTRFGQSLVVKETAMPILHWTGYDSDKKIWMQESVAIADLLSGKTINGSGYLQTLVNVLRAAHQQNSNVLTGGKGYEVETHLTFPRLWGLGTSSTWINNVAQWFNINAYQLLAESFGGSGYDIACAQNNQAVFYRFSSAIQPEVNPFPFKPIFAQHIYFVYLNQKQSSKAAIEHYKAKRTLIQNQVERISEISKALPTAQTLLQFQNLITEHEAVIGSVIEQPPVQKQLFRDFEGVVKSLGAWGGDFVMAVCQNNPKAYFTEKGYSTVLTFDEMIL